MPCTRRCISPKEVYAIPISQIVSINDQVFTLTSWVSVSHPASLSAVPQLHPTQWVNWMLFQSAGQVQNFGPGDDVYVLREQEQDRLPWDSRQTRTLATDRQAQIEETRQRPTLRLGRCATSCLFCAVSSGVDRTGCAKLGDEWVKFGWKATGLEAKQVKGGSGGLERSEVVGLGLQEIENTKSQKEEIAMVFFRVRIWRMKPGCQVDYGMYTEDGGFVLECWELELRGITFSPTNLQSERAPYVTSA